VAALLDEVFSKRDDQLQMLDNWLREGRIVVVAETEGAIVAVAVATVLEEADKTMYRRIVPTLDDWLAGRVAGPMNLMAVYPSHRGLGLAKCMARAIGKQLMARDVSAVVGVCWDHGGADTSRPLFEAAGFRELGRSVTFYAEEQVSSGQSCRFCGTPCRCPAVLFVLDSQSL